MMHFTDYNESDKHWIIDGYSDRKTKLGAIRDFGRWIRDNIDKDEGEAMIESGTECLMPLSAYDSRRWHEDGPVYYFEMEEVPCASLWHEDTEEMEYEKGNWYLVASIIKPWKGDK